MVAPTFPWSLLLMVSLLTRPVFSKQYGVVQLTSANFEEKVMKGGDGAWIVAVRGAGNVSMKKWAELEVELRGMMVNVGIIDPKMDGAFLKRMGFLTKEKTYTLARVYPYGGHKIKASGLMDVAKLSKARNMALKSLPDRTRKIQNGQELETFVNDAYATRPPRFPVLLFSEERTTLPVFRAVALKYSDYFNFGVMRNPHIEFRLRFMVETMPSIVVMLGHMDEKSRMLTFNSVRYDTDAYGKLSYFTLAKFLFSVHEKHWKEQPNAKKYRGEVHLRKLYLDDIRGIQETPQTFQEKPAPKPDPDDEKAATAVEITYENHKQFCSDSSLGLCVISYLDGRDKTSVRRSLRILKDVQNMAEMDAKPFKYLWVNASCHPEYGENFGVSPESLPTLLVAKPRQRLFTLMKANFEKESIASFLSAVLLGDENLQHYSRFNEMIDVECQEMHPVIENADPHVETTTEDLAEGEQKEIKGSQRSAEEL